MNKKIIGILICTLLFSVAVAPAAGTINVNKNTLKEQQIAVESVLQNEDLDSLLSSYGLDTEDTMGEFEQLLYNLVSKRKWRNPSLAAELMDDIDELSDILDQIGVTDDMTIAEALPIIEDNKEQLQEKGINLFCSIDIELTGGGCLPIFRLFKALCGRWGVGPDHATIKGLIGLQHCKGKECRWDCAGVFIGMIGFNPPVMLYCFFIDCVPVFTQINGDFTLFSCSDLPFVNSTGGSKQTQCPCNQQGNLQNNNMQSSSQQSTTSSTTQISQLLQQMVKTNR